MIVYYLDDTGVVREFNLGIVDIANQDAFNMEMDEKFPNGWSIDKRDLEEDIENESNNELGNAIAYDDFGDN